MSAALDIDVVVTALSYTLNCTDCPLARDDKLTQQ